MMTDLEKWKAFLAEFDIEFTLEAEHGVSGAMEITLKQGARHVSGYTGFLTAIIFDAEGKFLEIGAWE